MPKRKISSRIELLEQDSTAELSYRAFEELTKLLARRDALFYPWRYQTGLKGWTEIHLRQRQYLNQQEGLRLKADGKQDWKVVAEVRNVLMLHGLLDAKKTSGQVTSLFITAKGAALVHHLFPFLVSLVESQIVYRRALAFNQEVNAAIWENYLFGDPQATWMVGSPTQWNHLTDQVLPLLAVGAMRAVSCTQGRIFYRAEPDYQFPKPYCFDLQPIPELEDIYFDTFNAERLYLDSVDNRKPAEVGPIPIPASCYPLILPQLTPKAFEHDKHTR